MKTTARFATTTATTTATTMATTRPTRGRSREGMVAAEHHARGELATWAGTISVAASVRGVAEVRLPDWHAAARDLPLEDRPAAAAAVTRAGPPAAEEHLRAALDQLAAYFAGTRREFDVALDLAGGPFSRRAWEAVTDVPYGETRSYQEIAIALGAPMATRAVGAANGANPVPPFVPCHRIVGASGQLTGYGPGLPLKHALLVFEDAIPASDADYANWIERVRARLGTGAVWLGVRALSTCCRTDCPRAAAHMREPNRVFGTVQVALEAGFTPCPTCRPG